MANISIPLNEKTGLILKRCLQEAASQGLDADRLLAQVDKFLLEKDIEKREAEVAGLKKELEDM